MQEIKSNLGELLVSLVYNENLNRLTVTVIEARGLKVSQSPKNLISTYVDFCTYTYLRIVLMFLVV